MAWSNFAWVENVTKAVAARFNSQEEGIEEAKVAAAAAMARAVIATPAGGTANGWGYVGPLVSMAVSNEGLAEAGFLEDLEQYADGWTPEVALKPETTVAGTTRPKANISSFLASWKKIGPKKRPRGHTLLWWTGLARWMYLPGETINGVTGTWTGTEAEYRKEILAYIKDTVEQVGQRVDCWDVLNELTNSGKLRACAFTEICGKSLTIVKTNPVMQFYAECIRVAKEANPAASMFVNEYEIETAFNYEPAQRGTVFLEFINVLIELEAANSALYRAPDGIGMQFHTNTKRLVTAAEIQAIVPKYTEKELEVEITEFDCQIEPGDTEAKQGEVYSAMLEGAKKSGIGRVTIWGVTDKRSWLNTTWENSYALTANTAEAVSTLNLTGAEGKLIKLATPQVQVRFSAVTAGCGFSTGTTYYVVGSAANTFELAATEGGAAIKVTAGKTLLAAGTTVNKWAGESSPYPRPAPFGWTGTIKPAWRSAERSRPEQPGISAWENLTLNAKAKAKSAAQTPVARTVGLAVELAGQIEATEELGASATVATIANAASRPTVERQVPWVVNGASTFLTVGTNGAISIQSTDKLPALKVLRLDGLHFPLA